MRTTSTGQTSWQASQPTQRDGSRWSTTAPRSSNVRVSASVGPVVERFAGGSPFLASAVLRGLVESAALVAEGTGGWRVEPLAMADVQSSRHAAAMLARRIELLPVGAQRLLSVGAVHADAEHRDRG